MRCTRHLFFLACAAAVLRAAIAVIGASPRFHPEALEGHFELILANPYRVKNIPGSKTDARDSRWLAELLTHGPIKQSFAPAPPCRPQLCGEDLWSRGQRQQRYWKGKTPHNAVLPSAARWESTRRNVWSCQTASVERRFHPSLWP